MCTHQNRHEYKANRKLAKSLPVSALEKSLYRCTRTRMTLCTLCLISKPCNWILAYWKLIYKRKKNNSCRCISALMNISSVILLGVNLKLNSGQYSEMLVYWSVLMVLNWENDQTSEPNRSFARKENGTKSMSSESNIILPNWFHFWDLCEQNCWFIWDYDSPKSEDFRFLSL